MFESLQPLPPDPILGLNAAFKADDNPNKVDLGIGVYKDEKGNTPVMRAVKEAEKLILNSQLTKAYVGPKGALAYNEAVAELILGATLKAGLGGRRITMQTPGGCGGLRIAAEFIARASSGSTIWVSDPTWANHKPLIGSSGLKFKSYPYYNYETHSVDFDNMIAALANVPKGDVVLLHGCCHNPSGADLAPNQWRAIRDLAQEQNFTIFIDLAYQGMGDGLEEDVIGVRLLAESLPELIIVSSCSKNFGLYRERTGAITLICQNEGAASAASTLIAAAARSNYSMPPDHGAAVVQLIREDSSLNSMWEEELKEIRNRINGLRITFANRLTKSGAQRDFSFIQKEKGMFSFLGITKSQIDKLISEYAIYLVDSSRINVASINEDNIDYVTKSISEVLSRV
tara:strand:- start:155 stop:1354 length:1200 start_codon:yes stop_codon:yes gene_type:complete